VNDALGRLVQSVAADAQAHKRFWQAPLVPVHGTPTCDNAIADGNHIMLTGWERFGMGDPAYEIARSASQYRGSETSQRLASHYLDKAADPALSRRVQIYRRVWPFAELISLLATSAQNRETRPAHLAHSLRASLETYGWEPSTVERVVEDAQSWVSN
jgi:thiamine kinase-like enzyme